VLRACYEHVREAWDAMERALVMIAMEKQSFPGKTSVKTRGDTEWFIRRWANQGHGTVWRNRGHQDEVRDAAIPEF
jgi:cytosine/adenosine deaminase-related metal-dependent hydrolase